MKSQKILLFVVLVCCLFGRPVHALGPVDGEVGIAWWNNHFSADILDGEIDAGSIFAHGEVWMFDKWGVRGAYYDSDLEEEEFQDQQRLQLEVRRRFLSLGDNNFFALGAGLESIDLVSGESSDGLRLSAELRLGLPAAVFLYGKAAWSPYMGSAGNFDDISSTELEIGAHFTPFPFVSMRVGYLQYELDYDNTLSGMSSGSKSSGLFLGAGFHW